MSPGALMVLCDFGAGPKSAGRIVAVPTEYQNAQMAKARRWWHVRCDDAAQGRRLIARNDARVVASGTNP
jgi:hypothetical protein